MPPCLSVYRIIRYSDQVHCLIFVYRKVNRYVYCSSDPLLLFVVVNEQISRSKWHLNNITIKKIGSFIIFAYSLFYNDWIKLCTQFLQISLNNIKLSFYLT